MRNSLLAVSALLLVMGTAACSDAGSDSAASEGNGDSGETASEVTDEEQGLAFVDCMREQGVDLPDPEEGGGTQLGGPRGEIDTEDPAVQAALEECEHLMFGGRGSPPAPDEEDLEALREFAACMREQGIDMDDPSADGALSAPEGLDRGSEEFQAASEECQHLLDGQGVRISE